MANSCLVSADTITATDFQKHLEKYNSVMVAISDSKGARPGQKSLGELDHYRYGEALDNFGVQSASKAMGLDDVKTLVEWKLRHGKFRPTLMKMVSSNPPELVVSTIKGAIQGYQAGADVSQAVGALATLKGVGPATASLLLAVHDPDKVIFFADEAFHWLCCGGSKGPIKYSLNEYEALDRCARTLARRLRVRAVDVERVAFVMMRHDGQPLSEETQSAQTLSGTPHAESPAGVTKAQPAKRKGVADGEAGVETPVRRSKRGKQA